MKTAQKNGTANGKPSSDLPLVPYVKKPRLSLHGVSTPLPIEVCRRLAEVSKQIDLPVNVIISTCLNRHIWKPEGLLPRSPKTEAEKFRDWLEQTPAAATMEGQDFPRVKCAISEIELDVIDWMRIVRRSRESGKSIEYTIEALLEEALQS